MGPTIYKHPLLFISKFLVFTTNKFLNVHSFNVKVVNRTHTYLRALNKPKVNNVEPFLDQLIKGNEKVFNKYLYFNIDMFTFCLSINPLELVTINLAQK